MTFKIIRLVDQPEIKEQAAQWFHEKWGIPLQAYRESMEEIVLQISIRFLNGISRWKGKESSAAWASLKMISTTGKILRRMCALSIQKNRSAGKVLQEPC